METCDVNTIANELSSVSLPVAMMDWGRVAKLSTDELTSLNGRSRIGCKVIERYFFTERLRTKGNKGINFVEFARDYNAVYSKKRYIKNLIRFCDANGRYRDSLLKRLWYCYGLCFGRISPFKITNALSIYHEFNPTHVLDPFAGFGGRMAGAMIAGIDYTGYDTNLDLKHGYEQMKREMDVNGSGGCQKICFQDSCEVNFQSISLYDMVLTSPPYDNTEVYAYQPHRSVDEWDTFYNTVFTSSWDGLAVGGIYAINISPTIYSRVLIPLFGAAHKERNLKKSSRNKYSEMIYIWKK